MRYAVPASGRDRPRAADGDLVEPVQAPGGRLRTAAAGGADDRQHAPRGGDGVDVQDAVAGPHAAVRARLEPDDARLLGPRQPAVGLLDQRGGHERRVVGRDERDRDGRGEARVGRPGRRAREPGQRGRLRRPLPARGHPQPRGTGVEQLRDRRVGRRRIGGDPVGDEPAADRGDAARRRDRRPSTAGSAAAGRAGRAGSSLGVEGLADARPAAAAARGRHDPGRGGRGRGARRRSASPAARDRRAGRRRGDLLRPSSWPACAPWAGAAPGSAATRESDGATSVATRTSSVGVRGRRARGRVLGDGRLVRAHHRRRRERGDEHDRGDEGEDGGDRTVGHDTPDGQRVTLPLLDRQRSERSGGRPRRITNVVRFPT